MQMQRKSQFVYIVISEIGSETIRLNFNRHYFIVFKCILSIECVCEITTKFRLDIIFYLFFIKITIQGIDRQ